MAKISYGHSSRGVVAEFDQPQCVLENLTLPANPLLLVLDQIEKPGNVGAVFRSPMPPGSTQSFSAKTTAIPSIPTPFGPASGRCFESPRPARMRCG